MDKIELDMYGWPYCPTLEAGRAGMKYKARCVGCSVKCDAREEVEAIILERAKKRPVAVFVGHADFAQTAARLLGESFRVERIVVLPRICDDVAVQILPEDTDCAQPSAEIAIQEPQAIPFEPKINIKDYFTPVYIETEKRRQRADARQQHKLALRYSNKFRKK